MEKLASGYGLIEGPVWDSTHGLIFSDVIFGGVYNLDQSGNVNSLFKHRRGIGGMALHEAGGLVVSGRNISYKPFDGGDTVLVLDRDMEQGNIAYNDITTDSKGRIYAGSLGASPVFDDGRELSPGDLYLIELDGSSRKVAEDVLLTNGLAFSPDGKTLYHSDTLRKVVNCYSVNDDGSLGEKKKFISIEVGIPDGLVVSEDGNVWVALAGGGKGVAVYSKEGHLSQFLEISLYMCTSVCFGGEDLKDLYVVTGSDGTGLEKGGAIFLHKSDVPGMPVSEAKVSLASA